MHVVVNGVNFFLIWSFFLIDVLVSYLRLLQVLLDVDLETEVLRLNSGPALVGPKPLSVEDGALYPLGFRGAQCLTTVISGLLLQVRKELYIFFSFCLFSLYKYEKSNALSDSDPNRI